MNLREAFEKHFGLVIIKHHQIKPVRTGRCAHRFENANGKKIAFSGFKMHCLQSNNLSDSLTPALPICTEVMVPSVNVGSYIGVAQSSALPVSVHTIADKGTAFSNARFRMWSVKLEKVYEGFALFGAGRIMARGIKRRLSDFLRIWSAGVLGGLGGEEILSATVV